MENKIKIELERTEEILEWTKCQDISEIKRFFEKDPEKPLII